MKNRKTLELLLEGGRVTRFHTRSFLKAESNAEHSFFVAWVCWWCSEGDPSAKLLLAALSHDLPEYVTGDLPSPTKRLINGAMEAWEIEIFSATDLPPYAALLTPEETSVLKFADLCAGWLKCVYEAQMGNTTLTPVRNRYAQYIAEHLDNLAPESRFRAQSLIKHINGTLVAEYAINPLTRPGAVDVVR